MAMPPGSLANVRACDLVQQPLLPGQVRIRVTAVGLNFRDVLNVLGMYPGDAGAPGQIKPYSFAAQRNPYFSFYCAILVSYAGTKIHFGCKTCSGCYTFPVQHKKYLYISKVLNEVFPTTGSDCAGVIIEGKILLHGRTAGPGDRVFGLATGCLGTTVVASCSTVIPLPSSVLPEEGSAAPTVYITVDLALRAPVSSHWSGPGGCRVLLHAAAGQLLQSTFYPQYMRSVAYLRLESFNITNHTILNIFMPMNKL